jgi:hypothetical protein
MPGCVCLAFNVPACVCVVAVLARAYNSGARVCGCAVLSMWWLLVCCQEEVESLHAQLETAKKEIAARAYPYPGPCCPLGGRAILQLFIRANTNDHKAHAVAHSHPVSCPKYFWTLVRRMMRILPKLRVLVMRRFVACACVVVVVRTHTHTHTHTHSARGRIIWTAGCLDTVPRRH